MTIRELGTKLRSGESSCLNLVDQAIAAAEASQDLRAFITLTASQARNRAADLDRELKSGKDRGPLHGIPIALKDLFHARGIPTTAGSPAYADFTPDYDADTVQSLEAAGAISIGKTNLHELAFGITSLNPHHGFVQNPLDKNRLPGGSSGGSAAAIAARIVPMALGTDTGGSIRIPASFCGLAGLKPTYERVSRRGILPLSVSLDHGGPLGASVEDCAIAMNALTNYEEQFNRPPLANFQNIRFGIPANFFYDRLADGVLRSVRAAAKTMVDAGGQLIECTVPDFAAINAASRVIQFAEFASLYSDDTDTSSWGTDLRALFEQSRMIYGHEYVNAQRLRTVFRQEMDALWEKIDVLVTPTTPTTAPLAENDWVEIDGSKENVRMASTRLVRGINFLGEPALSMPCGNDELGLPVGLQLISAPYSDARLLEIAKTLEGILQRQA
jgi:aspartyl-tRNA(Asn)/glutamyl-tRNA(Gln) amidotransferase subunit A